MSLFTQHYLLLVADTPYVQDMHHNVLTILSPSTAETLLQDPAEDNVRRSLDDRLSVPDTCALDKHRQTQLWRALASMSLGLRQLREQYAGSSIVLGTSTYALTEIDSRTSEDIIRVCC